MAKTKETSKMIIIKHHGPIAIKGGIYGPTLPFREELPVIASLITRNYPVYEQLVDGSEIKLSLLNYDENHNTGLIKAVEFKEPVDPEPIPSQKPVVDNAVKGQQNGDNKQDNKSGNGQQNDNKSGGNQTGSQNNQSGKMQVNGAKDNNTNKADDLVKK